MKIGQAKVNTIMAQCEKDGINPAIICDKCNVKELTDITEKQFVWLNHNWKKEILNGVQGDN